MTRNDVFGSVLLTAIVLSSPAALTLSGSPAQAQAVVSEEFHVALAPYGAWQHSRRWGEVWIPANVRQDWRPYTLGHWVYTNEYGWYWASAPEEAGWGLITFHYGHWVFDDEFGWMWVPATRWGPGWVQWRRGAGYVGWAPLSPGGVEYAYPPEMWVFVRERDLVAPIIADVLLPPREVYLQETVVVSRTEFGDRGFGVNPGISPGYIAAAYGRPIPEYEIHPRILAGTGNFPGAILVRPEQFRSRERLREIVGAAPIGRELSRIPPATRVPSPRELGQNGRGRLGEFNERRPSRGELGNQGNQGRARFEQRLDRLGENPRPGPRNRASERPLREGIGRTGENGELGQGHRAFEEQRLPGNGRAPQFGQGRESRSNQPRPLSEFGRAPSTTGIAPSERRGSFEQGAGRFGEGGRRSQPVESGRGREFPAQRLFGRANPQERPAPGAGIGGAAGSGPRFGGEQRSFQGGPQHGSFGGAHGPTTSGMAPRGGHGRE